MFEVQGLDKNKIGEFFGKNKPFNQMVLNMFFKLFEFQNMQIDFSLRKVFKKLRLPKEF